MEKRNVIVAMSSFPLRKKGMLTVIRQLMPQCDKICVWLNDYKCIPTELLSFNQDKLLIKLANENSNLKENGRYTFINDFNDCYFLTVDDDLNYPSDYVKRMVSAIDNYDQKAIVAFHGTQFNKNMKEIWFPFRKNVSSNTQVHRIGGGVMGFVPSQVNFTCPSVSELRKWDGDASISVWATQHNVKKYVIAHNSTYITEQTDQHNNKISHMNALCSNTRTHNKRAMIYKQVKKWENLH